MRKAIMRKKIVKNSVGVSSPKIVIQLNILTVSIFSDQILCQFLKIVGLPKICWKMFLT